MATQHKRAIAPRPYRALAPTASGIHPQPGSRTAAHDERWPALAAALADLRARKRCSVRIVDADCGAGCLLLHALRHARTLGFTAIEGRGIDGSPALIGRARAAAARLYDPATGVVFEVKDMATGLRDEQDFPADIVLWRESPDTAQPAIVDALHQSGRVVIGDRHPSARAVA